VRSCGSPRALTCTAVQILAGLVSEEGRRLRRAEQSEGGSWRKRKPTVGGDLLSRTREEPQMNLSLGRDSRRGEWWAKIRTRTTQILVRPTQFIFVTVEGADRNSRWTSIFADTIFLTVHQYVLDNVHRLDKP